MIASTEEESPSYSETGLCLTDNWGNPRDSATESRPPSFDGKGETVR